MISKSEEVIIDTQSLEDKLGPELIQEIAEKDWKIAELPSEVELSQEQHKSSKARSNVNSRKNLVQYRKKVSTATKEKIVKALDVKQKRRSIDPFQIIHLLEGINQEDFRAFLPNRKVFFDGDEEESFYRVLNIFLKDFDPTELKASDIEDIISLAKNKILEDRLLDTGGNKESLLDVSASVDKLRKHSDKVKENLASRRSDRIDPRNKQNFSIVDLVQAFDEKRKNELEERLAKMEAEDAEFIRQKAARKVDE